ncbi:MAG: hypothetical protein N2385_07110 [Chloroflexus sp.]|nr:hypothetical protein [Chloroflexus sp.]
MTAHGPIIVHPRDDEPLAAAIARALSSPAVDHSQFAALSELLARDTYLAEQVTALRAGWAITPPPATTPLARLRRWLAWWLCGPELAQINATHATLTRLVESLIAHLDAERAARQALAERLAALEK